MFDDPNTRVNTPAWPNVGKSAESLWRQQDEGNEPYEPTAVPSAPF